MIRENPNMIQSEDSGNSLASKLNFLPRVTLIWAIVLFFISIFLFKKFKIQKALASAILLMQS
jgi:preprotein translocase subunit SecG